MMEITIIPEKKMIDSNDYCRLSVRLTLHLESRDKVIKKEIRKVWEQLEDDSGVDVLLELIKYFNRQIKEEQQSKKE